MASTSPCVAFPCAAEFTAQRQPPHGHDAWAAHAHLVVSGQEEQGVHGLRAGHLLGVHALQVHLVVVRRLLSIPPPLMRLRQPVQRYACTTIHL